MHLKVPRFSRSLSPRKYLNARNSSVENDEENHKNLSLSTARCSTKSPHRHHSPRIDAEISRIGNAKPPVTKIGICPSLSNYQVHLLKSVWAKLRNKNINKDITGCFQTLERVSSATSMSFNSVPKPKNHEGKLWQPQIIIDHTTNFIGLIDKIMANEPGMEEELRRLGASHVILNEKHGLNVTEFEKLGEIVADNFLKKDGVRQNNEATHAWCVFISTIIDYIKAGFETELKNRRRRYSISFTGEV